MQVKHFFTIGKSLLLLGASSAISFLANASVDPFSEDYDSLTPVSMGSELADAGWLVFANVHPGVDASGNSVFDLSGDALPSYPGPVKFNFGSFAAPNGGDGFSAVATGDGDADLDASGNYLNIYSQYACCDLGNAAGFQQGHGDDSSISNIVFPADNTARDIVHSLVFKEFTIDATDIGSTVTFSFAAKRPDIVPIGPLDGSAAVGNGCTKTCTAGAFVKTIDPNNSFNQTNLIEADMTSISQSTWESHSITIDLSDPALEGQILQIGFQNFVSEGNNSGVYYDNVTLDVLYSQNVPVNPLAIIGLGALLVYVYTSIKRIKTLVNA